MANGSVTANPVTAPGGPAFAADIINGIVNPIGKLAWGTSGTVNDTSLANPFPVQVVNPTPSTPSYTPSLGDAHEVVTAGTVVSAFLANSIVTGAYIFNPPSNTASIFVDPVQAATNVSPPTNGTTVELLPGQRWSAPGPLTTAVSVNASVNTTSFVAVRWATSTPPAKFTPTAGDAHAVVSNNTAVVAFTANSITNGAYIYNPPSNLNSIFVDMIQAATTTSPPTNGTTNEIYPGASWTPPGPLTTAVSVNCPSAQPFTAIRW